MPIFWVIMLVVNAFFALANAVVLLSGGNWFNAFAFIVCSLAVVLSAHVLGFVKE